ncbi:MAG: right-handed parallel beta-helix repeat-containing protein [Polyangiaceae bacterium]
MRRASSGMFAVFVGFGLTRALVGCSRQVVEPIVRDTLQSSGGNEAGQGGETSLGGQPTSGGTSSGGTGAEAGTTEGGSSSGGTSEGGGVAQGGTLASGGASPASGGSGGAFVAPDPCPNVLVGWGTYLDGISGGSAGKTVRVTTAADFKTYATQTAPVVIQVAARIMLTERIRPASDKTIVGVVDGAGFAAEGLYLVGVHNVIIQNLTMTNEGTEGDVITIQASQHVWVDHCDISNSYDDLIDVVHGSDFVTLSWNRLHDNKNATVIGHTDDDEALKEDPGHLTVTLHHNWFSAIPGSTPRVRFGRVHLFNNYFQDVATLAVSSTMGADVVVERNKFLRVPTPLVTHFVDKADGRATETDNLYEDSGTPTIGTPAVWKPSDSYSYKLDPVADVPPLLLACAGSGKL